MSKLSDGNEPDTASLSDAYLLPNFHFYTLHYRIYKKSYRISEIYLLPFHRRLN